MPCQLPVCRRGTHAIVEKLIMDYTIEAVIQFFLHAYALHGIDGGQSLNLRPNDQLKLKGKDPSRKARNKKLDVEGF